ncbi:hypothetical protein ES703_98245 [subsurface metagenome]
METVDAIAERLRQEPYHLLGVRKSNCIAKSFRLKRECRRIGVEARVEICIGLTRAKPLGFWIKMLTIHAWGEVDGRRVETAMPLGKVGIWGIIDIDIKPVVAIWL